NAAREQFTFGRIDRRISPYVVSHLAGSYLDAPEFITSKRAISDSDRREILISRLNDFARNLDGENNRIRHDTAAGITPPDFILDRTLARMREQQEKLVRGDLLRGQNDTDSAAQTILDKEVIPRLLQQFELLQPLRGHTPHKTRGSQLKFSEDCY